MNIHQDVFIIAAVLIVLLVVTKVFFFVRGVCARRGKSRMQILAEKIGFTLNPDWDYSLDHAILDFTFSGTDKARPASYNVLSASRDGTHWKIFDYNGSRPGRLWSLFRFQTMIYVEFTGLGLGDLGHYFITPYSVFGSFFVRFKITKVCGDVFACKVQDTPIGRFFIVAENKSVFTGVPQGLWEALGRDRRKPYSIEVLHNRAVFYRKNKVISFRGIPEFFDDVLQFIGLFKGKTAV